MTWKVFDGTGVIAMILLISITITAVDSAVYPFSYYEKTAYHALRDYNLTLTDISEEDCAFECRVQYSFTCRSFDYNVRTETCYLSSHTYQSLGVNLDEDNNFDYYQRIIGECPRPAVGVGDGSIPLDDISMSSFLGDMERGPIGISKAHVRLNSVGAWCSEELVDIDNFEEWVQVDMGELKYVHEIGTQGFSHKELDDIYVTRYYVTYSNISDSGPWSEYTENGARKEFKANEDKNNEVKNVLSPPVHAQWIRVHAIAAQSHPCMRLEVYGCKDDCQPNPCWNNATCVDNLPEVWNVTCNCLDGFVGDFCEIDFNECGSDPCNHGGTCIDHINGYTCICAPGWTGDHCEENIDECVSNPCQNGGTCGDDVNGYNCTCVDGYTGPLCQNFTVECGEGQIPGWHTCYLFVLESNQHADQPAAKEVCQSMRGHLFYPDNFEEQLYVGDQLIDAGADTSDIYYIGLTYILANGTEVITFDDGSGSPILSTWMTVNGTVDHWAQAYPTGNQACMAYLYESQGWVWRNLACDEVQGYICEIDRVHGNWSEWSEWSECSVTCGPGQGVQIRTRNCTNPAPLLTGDDCIGPSNETIPCGVVCPIVECPDGFIRRYDTCYKLELTANTDYNSAKTACEQLQDPYGSHLVFINDLEEEAFITEMLDEAGVNLGDVIYTGHQVQTSNISVDVSLDWQYSDAIGQSISMTSWESTNQSPWLLGQPSGSGSCVILSYNDTLGTWRWAASQCTASMGYICEANIGNGSYSDWSRWGDCNVTCGPGEGVQYRTRQCDDPAPILGGQNCTLPSTEAQSCGAECPTVSCPDGFIPMYDSCYLMVMNNTGTYDQAKDGCASSAPQAHLLHVNDYFEQRFLDYSLRKTWHVNDNAMFYTGNNYTGSDLAFDGADGSPNVTTWQYDNMAVWVSGYPDDSDATAVRVVLAYDSAEKMWLWANSDGTDSLGYICEQNQAPGSWGSWSPWSECSTSCGNGTQTRSRECNDPLPVLGGANCTGDDVDARVCFDPCPIVTCPHEFDTRYDSCYKVLLNDTLMYSQAKTVCEELTNSTGHLVYINNYDEQEYVHFELKSFGARTSDFYFTGMKYANQNLTFDDNSGGPTTSSWPNDSPWARNYPQNSGVACVALTYDAVLKEWLLGDHSCTSQLGYICEISQTSGNWGSWSGWSSCSATCDESAGLGTKYRNRTCNNPAPILGGEDCVGNATEWQSCGSQCPPEHGNWSEWNFTTECSVSCYSFDDSGNRFGGLRNRSRECNNPPPMYGGNDCVGDAEEVVECGTENGNACPPIDGGWSDWSNWTECLVTCGGGLENRTRNCDNPAPEHGGLNCAGSHHESRDCATTPCPVDGGWTNWSNWTECPVSCGGSTYTRTRSCSNPAPSSGGSQCVGNDTETDACGTNPCPIDGSWGGWGNWSDCPVTCGNAGQYVQVRSRQCDSPPAQYGGLDCPGSANETQTCATNPCPVDGNWAEWSDWGSCSSTCDGGTEKRRRNCTDPEPAHGGAECTGNDTESRSCGSTPCPVDGQWGDWSAWGECSVACAGSGTQSRTRSCDDPAAANGGSDCPAADDDTEYQNCGSQPCPINGGWGSWGSWSDCSISCGTGGVQYKQRLCDNPTPQYDGDDCVGDDTEREACDSSVSCRDINVALGKDTWQSSDAYSDQGLSSTAVDGDATATYSEGSCTHTSSETQPWWKVDLGGAFPVSSVYVVNRDTHMSRLDNMEVRVGMNWDHTENFRCGDIVESASATMTVECVEPIPGRYVSIQTINTTTAITLCEVEVTVGELAFHVSGSSGTYSLTYSDAATECKKYGAELATYDELYAAWETGLHVCAAGWLSDASVRYPLQYAQSGCGSSAGIQNWGYVATSNTYDAYCYIRDIEDGALGMGTGDISDSQIRVSQTASGGGNDGSEARLYLSDGDQAWCPSDSDTEDWISIDLENPATLKGVATSGRANADKYVTSYHLLYSSDGVDWYNYTEGSSVKLFQANFDSDTVVRHSLDPVLDVRYVKIKPQSWKDDINMRVELYGTYQPVVGGWSEWGSWAECTVTCEGSGIQQRTRTCTNPTPDHGAIRCLSNEFIDSLGDPVQYFAVTEGHHLQGYDDITYTNVTTVEECSSLCLFETTMNCSSFEYSTESQDCILSEDSATSLSMSLTAIAAAEISFDYYELEYHSCNVHYKIMKARGQSPSDGTYDISIPSYSGPVYCDMTRNGGGWTLLVTASEASGWDSSNVQERNVGTPSISDDYSVLVYADEIAATGNGTTMKYRLEANTFGLYGGVWEVPSSFSFNVEDDDSQESVIVERFSDWSSSSNTLRHIMPYIQTNDDKLLVAKQTNDNSNWGTVVCDCDSTSFDPAPWMSSEQSSPGIIWYWMREDRTQLEPTFHWDLSGKCYKEETDHHSCQNACVSNTVYPNVGNVFGTMSQTFPLTDARSSASQQCALLFAADYYLDMGEFEKMCLAKPQECLHGLTISVWVKVAHADVSSAAEQFIFSSAAASKGISLSYRLSNNVYMLKVMVRAASDGKYIHTSSTSFPDDEWFQVTVVFKNDYGVDLYVDGELDSYLHSGSSHQQSASNDYFIVGCSHNLLSNSNSYISGAAVSDLTIFYRFFDAKLAKLLYMSQGGDRDARRCGDDPCPIDGVWNSWGSWGSCTVECGSSGAHYRTRTCNGPYWGGNDCSGDDLEWEECDASSTCDSNDYSELGMDDGTIPDTHLSESEGASGSSAYGATYGRISETNNNYAWVPANPDTSDYFEIHFPYTATIRMVGIAGRPNYANEYVTEYSLSYSSDENGTVWADYEENGSVKIFTGNFDASTEVRETLSSDLTNVEYLRIYPYTWSTKISMRVAVYGAYQPIDGGYGEWSSWGSCTETCGTGSQDRTRSCDNPSPLFGGALCTGDSSESQDCNTNPCPVDGVFSSWVSTLGTCSIDCGNDGVEHQTRTCDDPAPAYGGANCTGDTERWHTCDAASGCSDDEDSALGVTDGTVPDGQLTESETGSNGEYSATWARLGDSTSTHCWSPANPDTDDWIQVELEDPITLKMVGTKGRPSDDYHVTEFNISYSQNGTDWEYYMENGEIHTFHGNFDGSTLVMNSLDEVNPVSYVRFHPQAWSGSICMRVEVYGIYNPIDGNWSTWSEWDTCTEMCGGGSQTRTRSCDNPAPKHSGNSCPGSSSEDQDCNTQNCPIDGGWSDWYDISVCSVDCGSSGVKEQARDCDNPVPQYGGNDCGTDNTTWASCTAASSCSASDDYALGVQTGGTYTIEDSAMSESEATGSSYTGSWARIGDSNADKAWVPSNSDTDDYLQIDLPDTVTLKRVAVQGRAASDGTEQWVDQYYVLYSNNGSEWGYVQENTYPKVFWGSFDSSTVATSTFSDVIADSVRFQPVTWYNSIAMRVELYGYYHAIHGEWTSWSAWSACPVTCDGGTETRTRSCTDPSPKYNGDDCPATDNSTESRDCNTDPCPIGGAWTTWEAWSSLTCTISCGTQGMKHRTRTCTNPPPEHGGADCPASDATEEFQPCDAVNDCGDCYEALGVEDGRISNGDMQASSSASAASNTAKHARFNIGSTVGEQCWLNNNTNETHGIEVTLQTPIKLTMVGVQGSSQLEQWVSYYYMQYTTDGVNYQYYSENNQTKRFYGNIDKTGIVKTTLDPISDVQGVLFEPDSWEGDSSCMRVEVYGCYDPTACTGEENMILSTATTDNGNVIVAFIGLHKVTMISTKGQNTNWLQGYSVYFSDNEIDWSMYTEDTQKRVFIGNSDATNTVTNPLMNPIVTQYIKLVPTTTHNGLSTDVIVYGCADGRETLETPSTTVCFTPFGLADWTFNSDRLSASSVLATNITGAYLPMYGRLGNPESVDSQQNGWVSAPGSEVNSRDQYLQIDFGQRVTITGVAVQGVETPFGVKYLSQFSLRYSVDGGVWKTLNEMGSDNKKIFNGTTDAETMKRIELTADGDTDVRPLTLQYLRIQSEVDTTDSVGLRIEVYGCTDVFDSACIAGYFPFESSCYSFMNDTTDATTAENNCQSDGGHLASINSLREQEFIQSNVMARQDAFLIGLNRESDFYTYTWNDGTFYGYSYWGNSQPYTDGLGKFGCVAVSENGTWITVDCGNDYKYVCEYEQAEVTHYACGEERIRLACMDNYNINVTSATWGRDDTSTCPSEVMPTSSSLPCTSDTALETIQGYCSHNNSWCELLLDDSTLGYPCNTAGIYLYGSVTYECQESMFQKRVCQGDFLDIDCGVDMEINIVDVMYGRTMDRSVCPDAWETGSLPTNCSMASAIDVVKSHCQGQPNCRMTVETVTFNSDPCQGVSKYLDVNYTCEATVEIIPDIYNYQGDCEDNWLKYEGMCFRAFPDDHQSHSDAQDTCLDMMSHLAGIEGANIQTFVEALVDDYTTVNTSFWIGCVKVDDDGCLWANGIGDAYTNFHALYQSNPAEGCVALSGEHSLSWDDEPCGAKYGYICQQECMLSFGMADHEILNTKLEVTSTKLVASLDTFKWLARLHNPFGAWVASERDTEQFLQVEFDYVMRVRKVATQGHPKYDYWVTAYKMDYSMNATINGSLITYSEDGVEKIFAGNNDSTTMAVQYLTEFMYAKFIRIVPLDWYAEIALRVEFYGCYLVDEKPFVLEVGNTTVLHYMHNGTVQCRVFGIPLATITWQKDGVDYTGGVNATIVTYAEDKYHMVSEIQFHPVSDDRGWYTCTGTNDYGVSSMNFYQYKGTPMHGGGIITCDGETLELECPDREFIKMTSATYSREHNEVCLIMDDYYPSDCVYNGDMVLYRVETQCNNKQRCQVDTNEMAFEVFGKSFRNCDGFTKYLNVSYECIGYEWTNWYDVSQPITDGNDDETVANIHGTLGYHDLCENPQDVECRLSSSGQDWYSTSDSLELPCTLSGKNKDGGIYCSEDDQNGGTCEDYEARFLCPQDDIGAYETERIVGCDDEEISFGCMDDRYLVIQEATYGRAEEGLCSTHGQNYSYWVVTGEIIWGIDTTGQAVVVATTLPSVTTAGETAANPTTAGPTTMAPTTAGPTTLLPTTDRTTLKITTSDPTTAAVVQTVLGNMENVTAGNTSPVAKTTVLNGPSTLPTTSAPTTAQLTTDLTTLMTTLQTTLEPTTFVPTTESLNITYLYELLNCSVTPTEEVLHTLKANCDNKQFCTMHVKLSDVLYDPCIGVPKYLDVKYTCEKHGNNKALNKVVVQSDIQPASELDTSHATDGMSSYELYDGSCTVVSDEHQPWITIDLGVPYNVTRVTVKSASGLEQALNSTLVRVGSNENIMDNDICGRILGLVKSEEHVFCSGQLEGRYVSIQATTNNGDLRSTVVPTVQGSENTTVNPPTQAPGAGYNFSVCEIEVYYDAEMPNVVRGCDNETLIMTCNHGYITLGDTFYGRALNSSVCPSNRASQNSQNFHNGDCTATESVVHDLVMDMCYGKHSCEIDVKSDILGGLVSAGESDPCDGVYKYLEISYNCSDFMKGSRSEDFTGTACIEDDLHIGCFGNNKVIDITSASYKVSSTTSPSRCVNENGVNTGSCSDFDATSNIQNYCNNKNSCVLRATDYFLGASSCNNVKRYLEVTYTCKDNVPSEQDIEVYACDGLEGELSLFCNDDEYIRIQDANWGRTADGDSTTTCPNKDFDTSATDCTASETLDIVKSYCEWHKYCSLKVDGDFMANLDPCPSTHKYLSVTYKCEPGRPKGDLVQRSCQDHGDLQLSCPEEQNNLRIIAAGFGRYEGEDVCPYRTDLETFTSNTDCDVPGVVAKVREICRNVQNCTVPNDWPYYTDREPCIGTYKYLQCKPIELTPFGEYQYFVNPVPELKQHALHGHTIANLTVRNILDCANRCIKITECISFNYRNSRDPGGFPCQLNNRLMIEEEDDFYFDAGYNYYEIDAYK